MVEFKRIETIKQCKDLYNLAVEINTEYYSPITGRELVDYMMEKFMAPTVSMEKISKGVDYFFVVLYNTNIGYFCLEYRDSGEVFLSKYYLKSDSRGKGFGKATFEKIVEIAKSKKCTHITLTVNRGNSHSIDIYKKLGFYVYDQKATDIGDGFIMDDYFMRYDIKD